MIAVSLVLLATASGMPARALTTTRTAQYRAGRAAAARFDLTGKAADDRGGDEGSYSFLFMEPNQGDTMGYVSGAGSISTEPKLGMLDVTKPWVVVTHTNSAGDVLCHTVTNVKRTDGSSLNLNEYWLEDTATYTAVVAKVACADGIDTELRFAWIRATLSTHDVWTYPFVGDTDDQYGNLAVHGTSHDSWFILCGDVAPCALDPEGQLFWRVYDANLTIALDS
jgi:hypothetical protein